ncbi:hypothetical protein Q7P36_010713 [Cladosporium allicinum]
MNRYGSGGPSKATSTTLCQKCLKRGHFSYECTASQQDRPYISRPSRTQQLANPKLAPKITNSAPVETPNIRFKHHQIERCCTWTQAKLRRRRLASQTIALGIITFERRLDLHHFDQSIAFTLASPSSFYRFTFTSWWWARA